MKRLYTRDEQVQCWPIPKRSDTCERCGAIDGIAGAHDIDGQWWDIAMIVYRYGFDWEMRGGFASRFGDQDATEAVVADGVCSHCREIAD